MGTAKMVFGYSAENGKFFIKDGIFEERIVEDICVLDAATGEEHIWPATLAKFGNRVTARGNALYIATAEKPNTRLKISGVYAQDEDVTCDDIERIDVAKLRAPTFGRLLFV